MNQVLVFRHLMFSAKKEERNAKNQLEPTTTTMRNNAVRMSPGSRKDLTGVLRLTATRSSGSLAGNSRSFSDAPAGTLASSSPMRHNPQGHKTERPIIWPPLTMAHSLATPLHPRRHDAWKGKRGGGAVRGQFVREIMTRQEKRGLVR